MTAPKDEVILIIEPDAALRENLRSSLQPPYRVYAIRKGSEVLKAAFHHRPKVILLDVHLPDRNGLEVLRELRRYPRTAHVPFIFMAGGADIFMKAEVLEAGAFDFIEKPIDLTELALRIRNVLRRGQEDGWLNPITRLPTGALITEATRNLPNPFYRLEISIAGYDPFKELHGFVNANDVINFAGMILSDVLAEHGNLEDFLGQRDEKRFVIITTPDRGSTIWEAIKDRLEQQLPQFHSFIERDQGYVEVPDNDGGLLQKPLMSLQFEISQSQ